MSIFPSETVTIGKLIKSTETFPTQLPLAKENAWDFSKNDFLLNSGKNVIVTDKEAVKVWMWKVLHTKKKRYKAYTSKYGNELESLLVNAYVTGVKDICTFGGSFRSY